MKESKGIFFKIRTCGFGAMLEDDEIIVNVFRHPFFFTLSKIVLRTIIWGGLAACFWFFYPTQLFYLWNFLGIIMIWKILSSYFFWHFNSILMTNENIILVEWPELFHRKFTRIDYWNIDEVGVERVGISSFAANYGTIFFAKVNGGELMKFTKANRPNYVARTIESYREKMVDSKNFTEESALKNLLSQMVQTHVGINGEPERLDHNKLPKNAIPQAEIKKVSKNPSQQKSENILVEKELDDLGGIEIDLES
jgi:hypothetical protein